MKEKKAEDMLEQGLLYKIMLLFNVPANWPAWKIMAGILALASAVGLFWAILTGQPLVALAAGIIMVIFMLADTMLLLVLPVKGVSFGPWRPQLFALALPRALLASLVGLVAPIAGIGWGLACLAGTQGVGLLALIWGAFVEPFRLRLTHVQVESHHLPQGTAPIRLLHLSDLHVERWTRREEKLLNLVDLAQPDLILITGDYLNLSYVRDAKAQADVRQLLSRLSAPHGVYAVLGSPTVDHRDLLPSLLADLPLQLIRDEWLTVDLGDHRRLVLLGLDCSHHLPTDSQKLDQLASAAPNSVPRVLLYHAPDLMPMVEGRSIDLYLCGHTHGGQVRLPWYGALLTSSQLGKRFEMGLYKEGSTQLYVSRGVGLEGMSAPRIRFLAPPEITLVTLAGTGET